MKFVYFTPNGLWLGPYEDYKMKDKSGQTKREENQAIV